MSISSQLSADGRELTISIEGRFDYSTHPDFRNAYQAISGKPESYIVDFATATYLDSSALGMLLLLRDHAGGDAAQIQLVNCNPDVRKVLLISSFDQLFSIP